VTFEECDSRRLVVQDRLGGELLIAEVHEADGSRQGVDYWNRLPDGRELDLTREQIRRGEVLGVRLLEAVPGAWVDLVAYECTLVGPGEPRVSGEHTALAFVEPDDLAGLPAAYAELIDACSSRPRS
jgi:hypothetical protein